MINSPNTIWLVFILKTKCPFQLMVSSYFYLISIRLNFLSNVWGNTDWNWSSIGQRSDISLTSGIGILLLLDTSFNISNGSKILYYDAQMFEFVHHSFGGIRLQINKDRNMCVISSSDLFCYVVHRVLKVWLYEIIIFI